MMRRLGTWAICFTAVLCAGCGPRRAAPQAGKQLAGVERLMNIPKKLTVGPRHVLGLESVLVVSTGKDVLAFSIGEKKPRRIPGVDAWLAATPKGFAIISKTGVTFCSQTGKIQKTFRGARPVFAISGKLAAVLRTVKGSPGIAYLSDELKVTAENRLRELASPTILDVATRTVLSVASGSLPFKPSLSITLWQDDKLLVDIGKKYTGARFLGASRTGRIYLTVPSGDHHKMVCLNIRGKEVWERDIPDKRGRISAWAVTAKSKDVIFLRYEDPAFKHQKGKLRLLLIGPAGRVIRDYSEASYNNPVVSVDSSYAMLTGKDKVHGIELPSGKTVWRKNTKDLLGGEDPRKIIAGGLSLVESEPLYLLLVASKPGDKKVPGKATILAISLRTGGLMYRKGLTGVGWKMYVSRKGTVWVVADDGKVHVIQLSKKR